MMGWEAAETGIRVSPRRAKHGKVFAPGRRAVEKDLSPYFALAQLHAERVGKSTGQSKRQHQHKTLEYLLMGLRDG